VEDRIGDKLLICLCQQLTVFCRRPRSTLALRRCETSGVNEDRGYGSSYIGVHCTATCDFFTAIEDTYNVTPHRVVLHQTGISVIANLEMVL